MMALQTSIFRLTTYSHRESTLTQVLHEAAYLMGHVQGSEMHKQFQ